MIFIVDLNRFKSMI